MLQVNVVLKEKYDKKTYTTTISYVNPNVENRLLKQLALALNNFTQNSYSQATREVKGDVL